ncbi:MAG: hypothetical protein V3U65_20240 [Granulosicoccaceae bacterium]
MAGEAIKLLNKKLNLPATGDEQDWEIELADANRINEFISFYENESLDDDKLYALMALIVGSLEDLACVHPIGEDVWEKISELLCSKYELHKPTIDYWSIVDNKCPDDLFKITKLMRSLKCC